MLDPQFFEEVFLAATTSLPNPKIPEATPTNVPPIPPVLPNRPTWERIGHAGHKTLWVVFAVMLLSSVVLSYLAWRTPVQKRFFHIITTFITVFATLSYFAMATGGGYNYVHTAIREPHEHVPDTVEHIFRQVYWVRYVDWAITTPLLLLDLSLLAGLNGANILVIIVTDLIMILTGLFSAFSNVDGTKWGWYTMACVAFLVIIYQLLIQGRTAVKTRDAQTVRLFSSLGIYTIIIWILYPIVWALAEGTHKWSVNTEVIAYAVLDLLAKPVFGFWLLFAHAKNIDNIDGFWAHGLSTEGRIRIVDDEA